MNFKMVYYFIHDKVKDKYHGCFMNKKFAFMWGDVSFAHEEWEILPMDSVKESKISVYAN